MCSRLFRAAAAAADRATHVLKTGDGSCVRVPALLATPAALPRRSSGCTREPHGAAGRAAAAGGVAEAQ
jgi:hypothetical protein